MSEERQHKHSLGLFTDLFFCFQGKVKNRLSIPDQIQIIYEFFPFLVNPEGFQIKHDLAKEWRAFAPSAKQFATFAQANFVLYPELFHNSPVFTRLHRRDQGHCLPDDCGSPI
jgi:hypothetical protein